MSLSMRGAWAVPIALALTCSTASALVAPLPAALRAATVATHAPARMRLDGSVTLPGESAVKIGNSERQRALAQGPAWQGFRARYGDWTAVWNEVTATPHRAFGRGIALAGFANDAAAVDRAVRGFIALNPALFGGAPSLDLIRSERIERRWYVSYRQRVAGLPVLFADWEFRVGDNGRLFGFGADAQGHVAVALGKGSTLAPAAARLAGRAGLAFDPLRDRVEGGTDLVYLPVPTETGVELRLVTPTRVITADPPGNWISYVDAATGEVLLRLNRVHSAISGTVTGTIHPNTATDPLTARLFRHLYVNVGPTQVVTDSVGKYTAVAAGTVTVSAALRGLYCDVNRADAPDASYSSPATNPATVDIAWGVTGLAHDAERDAYFQVNVAHDHLKVLEPGFTGLDYEMPCAVNVNQTCNSFWNGVGILFFVAGDGCVNSATVADVAHHEYGHGVNDFVYAAHGASGGGMNNGALHEGMADTYAGLLADDPVIGEGFDGPGTIIRDIQNTKRWPDDHSGEVHNDGLIIAGAFWDLRLAAGLAVAEHLSHYAKHGIPDDLSDGVAYSEFFFETLVADDDDANLANGTPHSNAIISAFNAHGIGTNYFVSIASTPIADQPAGAAQPLTATVQYTGPRFGALDTASPTVHVIVNRGPETTQRLLPTGAANQYRASIPAPPLSVVEYWITAADTYGGAVALPSGAPAAQRFRFTVGPTATASTRDMESDPGWTVGSPQDAAVTGIWERVDPEGTYTGDGPNLQPVQPEEDHTALGTMCWVTGGLAGGGVGANDVDGGRTTLTSHTFSALGIAHPSIEYHRWYTNNAGNAPGFDVWRVDISNDGGTSWTAVENTPAAANLWQRILIRIEDLVTPTAIMKMRFVAEDAGDGSIIEAAVDDWKLFGFTGPLAAPEPAAPGALAFAPASPNPFAARTTLRYALPTAGPVRLRIYGVDGRLVRTLADGDAAVGTHVAIWDGRDDAGRPVASGSYFARIDQAGREAVERVLRLR